MHSRILCFVNHLSLYNLVNKANLVHSLFLACLFVVYEGESNESPKTLNIFCLIIYWTQKAHNDSFFYVVSTASHTSVPALQKCMNTSRKKKILLAESADIRAPGRGECVTELMPFMNFSVHSYTCCSDRHASPYWTFISRWISMGFTPSLLKNGWQTLFFCGAYCKRGSHS